MSYNSCDFTVDCVCFATFRIAAFGRERRAKFRLAGGGGGIGIDGVRVHGMRPSKHEGETKKVKSEKCKGEKWREGKKEVAGGARVG